MKRIVSVLMIALSGLASAFSLDFKDSTSLTFSVTPIDKDEEDKVQFGGSYLLAESTLTDKYVTLGGKLYYRLKATDSKSDESQELEVKRAYAKIRPFGNGILELAIGKLYSYYLDGGYFSLTETYTGATRWGKTGVGLKSEVAGFTFGAALPVAESNSSLKKTNKEYYYFRNDWGLNGSVSYDFSSIIMELPLVLGTSVLYSASGKGNSDGNSDGEENVFSVSKDDFAECVSLNFSKKNLAFFKSFSVFAAFSHNVEPYVSSSVFKPVANYANKEMKKSNLFSFAIRPTIGKVRITSESEIGHSIEGNMVPFYSALQVYAPIYGAVAIKPMAGYYAAYDTSDSSKSFDSWEIYPRVMLEFEKWTFTAGWDMFYKKILETTKVGKKTEENTYYRWTWTVPITAKLRIGSK